MIRYRMALLGGFELRDQGGEIIHLPGTQAALLLAILALNSGQPVSRLKLIKYLWEDRDEPQGRSTAYDRRFGLSVAHSSRTVMT